MSTKIVKQESEKLRRRKRTFYKKAIELGQFTGIDVAVITRQTNRHSIYNSTTDGLWPPPMEDIVSSP